MNVDETTNQKLNLTGWARGHRVSLAALAHVALFALSWLTAFALAYNFQQTLSFKDGSPGWFWTFFLPLLPIVVTAKFCTFLAMGLHRGSWRYVSMRDLIHVTHASWWSFVWIFLAYYTIANLEPGARLLGHDEFTFIPFGGRNFPDSALLLDFAGTIALVCGARIAVRLYHEEVQPVLEGSAPKLLIVGAGNAGENVVREILPTGARVPSGRIPR